MRLQYFEENEISEYENFLISSPLSTITQSGAWGQFQSSLPERGKTWRLGLYNDNEQLIAACLLVKHKLPKGLSWLYSQGGPIGDYEGDLSWLNILGDEVKKIAGAEKSVFWRISPLLKPEYKRKFKKFKKAHMQYQPESTLIIDLTKSEDEILKDMKPKGRYNIKIAKKHEVKIRFSNGSNGDIEYFYKLLKKTTARDGFSAHAFEYYHKMIQSLSLANNAELALAEAEGELLAGAILTYYGNKAVYYYGASGDIKKNYMAPYLMQWEMIKRSKEKGYKLYDFLGIAPENAKKHPWVGVSEFKLKFGGQRVNYMPEQELVFKPVLYGLMKFVKKLRR